MTDEILALPVDRITPDPENLRQTFDEAELNALADNLVAIGQTDPIQVFERPDGTFDLFDGERRWRAAKIAGLKSLRAIIISRPNDQDLLVKKVSRMMQTKTLTFPEEVRALEDGLIALGVRDNSSNWSEAAKRLGVPPGVLRERMRVRSLSSRLRTAFDEGQLDYTIAQTLGRIPSDKRQEELADFIEEAKLSNRFVTTKFIQAAIEFPELPPIEVYDIARQRERFGFAEPRKEDIPEGTVDQLDKILADIRKVQGWLETVSRGDFLGELHESQFNSKRFWTTLHRLYGMLEGFFRVHAWTYASQDPDFAGIVRQLQASEGRLLPSPPEDLN